MDPRRLAVLEIVNELEETINERELLRMKLKVGEKYRLAKTIRNSEILECLPESKKTAEMVNLLKIRATRSLSGIVPIAVMCLANKCPHGRCTYCPKGDNAAQSYTGEEPVSMRAAQSNFDPYLQTKQRIEQLQAIGHKVQKCELIILGGTFNSEPYSYQQFFMKRCLDAMNGFDSETVEQALIANEKAEFRAVGITFETKPDWCKKEHIEKMLNFGVTRVEIGVQVLSDEIYKKVNRGHTLRDVVESTAQAKDSYLKVLYHMMPGLFTDPKKDVEDFRTLFENPDFRPDMLKIYPCVVLPNTALYQMWKRGMFTPYTTEEAAEVLVEATKYIPPYVRVMRIQREIPANVIQAGVKNTNLRQIVERKLKERGIKCRCIRCREVGLRMKQDDIVLDESRIELKRIEYEASGGKEIFLSYEETENDLLIGFLRLREHGENKFRQEIGDSSMGVRELHVYSEALHLHEKPGENYQHKGYGKLLLAEAERIAREEFDKKKLLVISGVGAREYYYKLGYNREGAYVSKELH
ncbi:tRNA uridine(34) 5-carboxymethylaminomethyl modification radical SAM/GNAT enzyme Elp3 [Candidatus Micrarchaeota archaeon]|nr:tRNA uridine(34) 5-carboxymethylaminomethyl modification radical SAM/GNAT enzyme Elp3 [Candidatus Micrarchaeota archaeon]